MREMFWNTSVLQIVTQKTVQKTGYKSENTASLSQITSG